MAKHGRYKIVRKVADGGMAEIFLATQLGREGFQKPVILKRIHSTIYADPQFRNMFIDEAHISMGLSHSNIVQILDLGVGGGRYFLVLELVDGWDLGRILQRAHAAGSPLPRELGLHIAADVCRALAYAHAKTDGASDSPMGIVHRDVSPHNILVSEQGEVKLTDFGIAKAMNKREQTGTGVVKGKVAFMSPEQAMGRAIDPRSDLFALGTVLYLLMTRVRPFEAPTDLETLLRVQKGDFLPPQEKAPDLPPEVAEIIMRAMQLDPANRYQSADEMLIDIERVVRRVYQPVGQTELKRWLTELHARDGVPTIGKAPGGPTVGRTGSGDLEGKDVVLSDTSQEQELLGEEETSLAVLESGSEGRRLTRQRPELSLPVPDDAEGAQSGRHSQSEFSLPIPDEEGPPGRRRARRSSGWSILFFGLLLVGGAAAAGRYLGLRAEQKDDKRAGAPAEPAAAAADAAAAAAAATADTDAGAAREPPTTAKRTEPTPAREAVARRSRSERPSEHIRHDINDLKNMMAPDPSLLPAPTPPPPPPRAVEPPPPPAAPENP